MTIHGDWLRLFKTWAPQAFDVNLIQEDGGEPAEREEEGQKVAAFIDAQIKLMSLPSLPSSEEEPKDGLKRPMGIASSSSWEHFIRSQFVRPVENMWKRYAYLAFKKTLHVTHQNSTRGLKKTDTRPLKPCTADSDKTV